MNLNQITIYSGKPLETVDFFLKLGLQLIVDSRPRYARMLCPDGGATLSVHLADETLTASSIVLYFECDDLDGKVSELKALELEFESEPEDQNWLWRESYLRDPNGNRICLYFAGENRQNPPWLIKS